MGNEYENSHSLLSRHTNNKLKGLIYMRVTPPPPLFLDHGQTLPGTVVYLQKDNEFRPVPFDPGVLYM